MSQCVGVGVKACFVAVVACAITGRAEVPRFLAGAAQLDVSPAVYPVIINGGFEERSADKLHDPLYAKAVVVSDGSTKIAICTVDSCMLPRELIDQAKDLVTKEIGIGADRILVSATHTHSTPAAMGCLGSRVDPNYPAQLIPLIARAIVQAHARLAPAEIGWAKITDAEHTFNRRWIRRPDKMLTDPFGVKSVRAHMHPGYQNPDAIGPSGPTDPDLTVVALRKVSGPPVAVWANYSMHYFGSPAVSADYFGVFAADLKQRLGIKESDDCVVAMSQGTSGDLASLDYSRSKATWNLTTYSQGVAAQAFAAYQKIKYSAQAPLAMQELKVKLTRRVADAERLAWAKEKAAEIKNDIPKGQPQIYAREQLLLAAEPERELKLQAIKIGELGIVAIPNEVFCLTGLKLKAQSPLVGTFVMSLANGSEGYIPPPEQHALGGYTTWAARTAALEVPAETKITETCLQLLEKVSGKPRREVTEPQGTYARAILDSKPLVYWRLADMAGPTCRNETGSHSRGILEPGVALYLEGPPGNQFSTASTINRCLHFAGGRLRLPSEKQTPATVQQPPPTKYSIEAWFWNGLPNNFRPVTGYLFSRGRDGVQDGPGDHLGIGGTHVAAGKLLLYGGEGTRALTGKTEISPQSWHQVVFTRDGRQVAVYLDGQATPEITGELAVANAEKPVEMFFGGRSDNFANWEGKLDELSVYDRPLSPTEVAQHYRAAGRDPYQTSTPLKHAEPLSPKEAHQRIVVPDDLRVDLIAAEPDVQSPVAMAFDAQGRLFVVEMLDYPTGPPAGNPPQGRIRILERGRDGRYHARPKPFADKLLFANGVLPWGKGVFVTCAPHILYLEDTDGDGVADVKQVLFEGFTVGNPQLRVSYPLVGLDGRIYVANGQQGGKIRTVSKPDAPVIDIGGRDFCFDPVTLAAEAISGMGQFGATFDAYGHRFTCTNRNHWIHDPLPQRYLARNPNVVPPIRPRDNQGPGGAARVYPLIPQAATFPEHAGSFTAACGVFAYRGNALPAAYRDCVFTCEPTGHLIHQEALIPNGATFVGRPAKPGVEFLASRDPWFRPVFITEGPDGAMYVVDFYRPMIEHPEWLPKELKKDPSLWVGIERGRIYRVAAPTPPSPPVDVSAQTAIEQAWQAHRDGKFSLTAARDLLAHPAPRVREHAVRLAEGWLRTDATIQEHFLKLAADPDAAVRFQVALSLGEWDDERTLPALAQIASAGVADSWTRLAVQTAVPKRAGQLLTRLAAEPAWFAEPTSDRLTFFRELAGLVGSRQDVDEVRHVLNAMFAWSGEHSATWQLAVRRGLSEGLARRGSNWDKLLTKLSADRDVFAQKLTGLMEGTIRTAQASSAPLAERTAAISMLSQIDAATAEPILGRLLSATEPEEVQLAAVGALGTFPQPAVATKLVSAYAQLQPAARRAALEAFLSQPERTLALLAALEGGQIELTEIDSLRRAQLLNHRRSDVRERTARALAKVATPERKQIVAEYQVALQLAGDVRRGREAFKKGTCNACHKIGTLGVAVGPDIADTRTKTPAQLVNDILDPNAAIDANYFSYLVALNDGRVLSGLLSSETATSVTLRRADGQTDTVLRQDIETIISSGKSLMPEGVEKNLTPQDVADLLAFLKNWQATE